MSKLEIKNLSFSYDNEHPAIDDVSFAVEKGSFVAILGHNGSGKSTLSKLIVGLLEKNKGQIFFDNEEMDKKTIKKLQTKTALVSLSLPRKLICWKSSSRRRMVSASIGCEAASSSLSFFFSSIRRSTP